MKSFQDDNASNMYEEIKRMIYEAASETLHKTQLILKQKSSGRMNQLRN